MHSSQNAQLKTLTWGPGTVLALLHYCLIIHALVIACLVSSSTQTPESCGLALHDIAVTDFVDSLGVLQISQHQLKQYEADSDAPQPVQLRESLERVQSLQGRLNSVEEQVWLLHVLGQAASAVSHCPGHVTYASCVCKTCALAAPAVFC